MATPRPVPQRRGISGEEQTAMAVLLAAGVIIGSFFSPSVNPNANAQQKTPQWRYQTIHGTGKSIFSNINNSLNNGGELVDLKTTPQNGYSTPYTVAVVRTRRQLRV